MPEKPVVLIVEDELLIRMNAVEVVEDLGFEVVQARNADEAIAILELQPAIHIVFTDIHMPGSMDGLRLARYRSGPMAAGQDHHDVGKSPAV